MKYSERFLVHFTHFSFVFLLFFSMVKSLYPSHITRDTQPSRHLHSHEYMKQYIHPFLLKGKVQEKY